MKVSIKMFIRFVMPLILVLNIVRGSYSQFCVVEFAAPAIIWNRTDGASYPSSAFDKFGKTLHLNRSDKNSWKILISADATDTGRDLGAVLDQRWEHFLFNSGADNRRTAETYFNQSAFDIYLSIKTNRFNGTFNLTSPQWKHVRVRKISQEANITLSGNDSGQLNHTDFLDTHIKTSDLWKLHNYTYLYKDIVKSPTRTVIYNNAVNCNEIQRYKCLSFHLAMCADCSVTITLEANRNQYNKTFNSTKNGTWQQENLCLDVGKFNECFALMADTHNITHGVPFWAIGEEFYILNCTNAIRYLSKNVGCESPVNASLKINTTNRTDDCKDAEYVVTTPTPTDAVQNTSTPMKETTTASHNNRSDDENDTNFLKYLIITIPTILVLVLLTGVLIFVWRRKFRSSDSCYSSELEFAPLMKQPVNKQISAEFMSYVKSAFEKSYESFNSLEEQFQLLPTNYLRESRHGKAQENRDKNIVRGIVPYDDSRVILTQVGHDDPYFTGDYINASYITGVQNNKEYIITQNPKLNTVDDFWRMVWQEGVKDIIMISTNRQTDFCIYWPGNVTETLTFAGIEVKLVKLTTYEFYVVREMLVRFGDSQRLVSQLHFDTWFEHQAPIFPYILVPLIEEFASMARSNPILVHCHAGIGRSGVVVLCDMALQMIKANRIFSMSSIVRQLREFRFNLVENLRYYKLANLALYEYLLEHNASICLRRHNFDSCYNNWEKISKEAYKTLKIHSWINEAIEPLERDHTSEDKRRYPNESLLVHSQVIIQDITKDDYIHAHHVDGYRSKIRYIATQQPLKSTLEDFWTMVVEHRTSFIVNLNEIRRFTDNYCQFYPNEINKQYVFEKETFSITRIDSETGTDYDLISLKIVKDSVPHEVTCLDLKGWPKCHEVPKKTEQLIEISRILQNNMKNDEVAVICCDNGIRASGLFVCLCYLLDKAVEEKQYDVIAAVRAVRRSHPDFVTERQFDFLCKCVEEHHKMSD